MGSTTTFLVFAIVLLLISFEVMPFLVSQTLAGAPPPEILVVADDDASSYAGRGTS